VEVFGEDAGRSSHQHLSVYSNLVIPRSYLLHLSLILRALLFTHSHVSPYLILISLMVILEHRTALTLHLILIQNSRQLSCKIRCLLKLYLFLAR
jgi:hypothetical protein